jgi:SP family general alpha glucoside:H+ symporter-like MFS transporter
MFLYAYIQLGSLYGMPAFKERFGNIMTKTGPAVDPNWQTAGQFVGLPGSFLGLWLCGWGQERYGSRKTYLAGMVAVTLVIFLYVFMQNLPMLLAAQALASGCWSLFSE